MYKSVRSQISSDEHLKLLGLKTLAMEHERQLKFISKAIHGILMEVDADGHLIPLDGSTWAGELTYTEKTVDEVLRILKIEVKELE